MQAIEMSALMVYMRLCMRYVVSEQSPKSLVVRSKMATLPRRQIKKVSGDLFRRLTGQSLRTLLIRAGFPYHKAPRDFQWLWVYILLPFLEEESLNELSDTYGKSLRNLYSLLIHYPQAFERLMQLLAEPLFFNSSTNFIGVTPAIKVVIVPR